MEERLPESEGRARRILDAARELFIRYGYDKTTMRDVAAAVGLGRGLVYLEFKSKEALFEALLLEELALYIRAWEAYILADPRGGTVGSLYRGVVHAMNSRPFMRVTMRRDGHLLGKYLYKPDNLLTSLQWDALWIEAVGVLQEAGMVRKEIAPAVIVQIINVVTNGLVNSYDFFGEVYDAAYGGAGQEGREAAKKTASRDAGGEAGEDASVSFETVMGALAEMMDRALTPETLGDTAAAKEVVHRIAELAEAQFVRLEDIFESRKQI